MDKVVEQYLKHPIALADYRLNTMRAWLKHYESIGDTVYAGNARKALVVYQAQRRLAMETAPRMDDTPIKDVETMKAIAEFNEKAAEELLPDLIKAVEGSTPDAPEPVTEI